MKILSAQQIRQADAYTIANEPIASIDLMERAGNACADWIISHFTTQLPIAVFCGTGNNGGDGLVIARVLSNYGYNVSVFVIWNTLSASEDFNINFQRLRQVPQLNIYEIHEISELIIPKHKTLIIDALLGSGLSRPVEGLYAQVINAINHSGYQVIAIDLPSGLFADSTSLIKNNSIIKAHITLSLELPKLAMMMAENGLFTGELVVVPIGLHSGFISTVETKNYLIEDYEIATFLKNRQKFSHKGHFGHALLIAGSYGKAGAAILAAKACLSSGAGLVTVHLPQKCITALQASFPEAMVSIDESENEFSSLPDISRFRVVGIGPGIGTAEQTVKSLKVLIQQSRFPLVLDADALNILSDNPTWLSFLPKGSIVTPHPGEFERLVGKSDNDFERLEKAKNMAFRFQIYVILKGAHTVVCTPDGQCFFNSTGNAGMATAGSGDVLTGIITGLMAQNYSSLKACLLGVYIHGLAADIALENSSMESLLASDIISNLGKSFMKLHKIKREIQMK